MKKILVVLLILAVAGGLFAQGLTLSGELKTGIGIITPDNTVANDKDDDTMFVIGHDDPDGETRVRLNGLYEGENHGVKFGIQASDLGTDPALPAVEKYVTIYNAYAWVDLFDDMANLKVGLVDDGVWTTGGDKDWGLATGTELRLEITPAAYIEGLNLGFALKSNAVAREVGLVGDGKGKGNFGETFDGIVLGASYDSDLFRVAFAMDLNGGDADVAKDFIQPVADDFIAIAGLSIKAVENLTAIIEGKFYIADEDDLGAVWLTEKFEYAIADNFRAGLVSHQKFLGADIKAQGIEDNDKFVADASGWGYVMFKLYGAYDLTDVWTAGLDLKFDTWFHADADADWNNSTAISIKPNLTYKVADNATIAIFDEIVIPMDGKEVKEEANAGTFGEGRDVTNRFQVSFTYAF
jgi:hypothetical protein